MLRATVVLYCFFAVISCQSELLFFSYQFFQNSPNYQKADFSTETSVEIVGIYVANDFASQNILLSENHGKIIRESVWAHYTTLCNKTSFQLAGVLQRAKYKQ